MGFLLLKILKKVTYLFGLVNKEGRGNYLLNAAGINAASDVKVLGVDNSDYVVYGVIIYYKS